MKKVIIVLLAVMSVALFNFNNPNTASAEITNGMEATSVLGQVDVNNDPTFGQSTANSGLGSTNAYGVFRAFGTAVDPINNRLFVADNGNNRVIIHQLDSNNQVVDSQTDYVLGQANFTASAAATTAAGMSQPTGIAFDANRELLYVLELGNRRVLVFDLSEGITNGMDATYVLGQPDFTTAVTEVSQSKFGGALHYGLALDATNQRLYVANYAVHRVLVFDVDEITDGEPAINVLGQANFTTGTSGTTQSTMNSPGAVAIDVPNQRLFVVENTNKRVLVFDVEEITDGEPAINVLGQTDFTSSSSATTQSKFGGPYGVTYNPVDEQLFVADTLANRVLVFDLSEGITNGMDATYVLGQPGFVTSLASNTASGVNFPISITLVPQTGTLFIGEYNGNRVSIYSAITTPGDEEGNPTTTSTSTTSTTTSTTTSMAPSSTTTPDEEQGPNNGDGNNDGIPDSEQPNVTTIVNSALKIDGGYIVLSAPNTCTNESVSVVTKSQAGVEDEYNYPAGLLDFTIDCVTPGVSVTIEHYYYGLDYAAEDFIGRKFTSYDGVIRTLEGSSVTNEVIDNKHVVKLVYSLTDGGQFDNDQLANGKIVDPAGLGTTLTQGSLARTGSNVIGIVWLAIAIMVFGGVIFIASRRRSTT